MSVRFTPSLQQDYALCGRVLQYLVAKVMQGYVFEGADHGRCGLKVSLNLRGVHYILKQLGAYECIFKKL